MASKEQAKKVLLVADNDANREILKYNEQVENYNALVIKYNGSRVPVAGGKYSGRTITNIDEVEINPNGKYAYGVDIGGTTVKIGYFSTGGELLDKWEIPTVKTNQGEQILPDIAKSIKEHMAKKNITFDDLTGVGMGAPGPVDGLGVIYGAANLGWGTFNISKRMSELLNGICVKSGNDANVAALGEMWKGGAQGYHHVVAITLGTGVGAGVISNEKILAGCIGAAGEVGHIHVVDDEPDTCGCGNQGCLEQYASATGVVKMAKRMLEKSKKESSLRALKDITAKDVWDAVKAGDELAKELAEEFGKLLGKGLSFVADVVNPEIFVIGGGVSKAGNVLIEYCQKYYIKYVFKGSRDAKIVLAALGNDGGIYGAAKLVIE